MKMGSMKSNHPLVQRAMERLACGGAVKMASGGMAEDDDDEGDDDAVMGNEIPVVDNDLFGSEDLDTAEKMAEGGMPNDRKAKIRAILARLK